MKTNFISILLTFLLISSFSSFGQEYIDDSNFDTKINEKHAFGDDDQNIVVVEFWAKFNDVNAFQDWDKVKGVKYFRVDIAKAPAAKKKYRIKTTEQTFKWFVGDFYELGSYVKPWSSQKSQNICRNSAKKNIFAVFQHYKEPFKNYQIIANESP